MQAAPVWLAGSLESAFNAWLRLDPQACEELATLSGRVLALEITGVDLRLVLVPGTDGLHILGHYEGEPDAVLSGSPLSFIRMGLSDNAGDRLLEGDIQLRGDTELGQQFRQVLALVEIDWEDLLSKLTGDVVAHRVGRSLREAGDHASRNAESLGKNTAEYLSEELRLVATPTEIDEFNAGTDQLREQADRLLARLQRLERLHVESS